MSDIQILTRGSFRPLPGATATQLATNAWRVEVPRTDAVKRAARAKAVSVEFFDGATFLIGDDESWSAVGESEDANIVVVTVLV